MSGVGRDVYVVEAIRTPIASGRNEKGLLHNIHPVTLLSIVLDQVTARVDVNKKHVDDVICGCVTPIGDQGANIPRLALLKAGYPVTVPGVQLNRMCGSSQQAIHFAAQAIASGDQDLVVACGIEMMSRVPMGSDCPKELFANSGNPDSLPFAPFPFPLIHQGVSAEKIGTAYKISRKECDEFAVESHKKCFEATKKGNFKSQIVPIKIAEDKWLAHDEGIRYPTDVEVLGKLKPVFKKEGVVTAGNASQISDGASAVLLASAEKCKQLGLKPRAKVVARVVVGHDPVMMLDGIIPATKKVLEKANLKLEDIDLFEVNEAFATVVLSWQKTLKVPMEKVNIDGGAIAHGHPLGASGGALATKLINQLERTGKKYGLQTMCIGHGQSCATIFVLVSSEEWNNIHNTTSSKM